LTVTVTRPQTASLTQKITPNGNLAAWQEAIVGAEANGLKITEVRVNVGDRVQRGDVLAVLQADSLLPEAAASAQEAQAQAQAEHARSLQQ
jgi:multidrug efflux pump subunit AcrA (membrane-fusion protein)